MVLTLALTLPVVAAMGSLLIPPAYTKNLYLTYSAAGTYTVEIPASAINISVGIWGGGGGGGAGIPCGADYCGGTYRYTAGGGGGGASNSIKTWPSVSASTVINITLGAGGAGATTTGTNLIKSNSTNGESSTATMLGDTVTSGGGQRGISGVEPSALPYGRGKGGEGGTASGGDTNYTGQIGTNGTSSTGNGAAGGRGGLAAHGGGHGGAGGTMANGMTGSWPGGGGGGGGSSTVSGDWDKNGGNGGPGGARINYTYYTPTITSVSPSSGLTTGGEMITLTGSDLAGTTAVRIGNQACASFTVVSDTSVKCVTPAGTAGTVDVEVTAYKETATKTAAYTYVAPFISLALSDPQINLSGPPRQLLADHLTANVRTNLLNGYRLDIEAAEPRLKCAVSNNYIKPLTSAGPMANNYWGYAVDSNVTPTEPSSWLGLSAVPATIKNFSTATDPTAGDNTRIWFATQADHTLPACNYKGVITITAMGK